MLHNKYNQYFTSWIKHKSFNLVKILPKWTTLTTHSVIIYKMFITNILQTNDLCTEWSNTPSSCLFYPHERTTHRLLSTPPSLSWGQFAVHPPLHLGGIRLVCLWVGIRLVWPAAESRSPGYRSACETHVLTHLGPHPRRCPGEWTPHPEKPQNIIHLDHIVTQFHT